MSEWIYCNDKVPIVNEKVLIYYDNDIGIAFGRYLGNDVWEWLFEDGWDYWVETETPVAWMSIPNPSHLKP